MKDRFLISFTLIGLVIVGFIVLPISVTILMQVSDAESFIETLKDPLVLESVKNSLLTATAATLIAAAFGIPLGYVLAREDFCGKSLIQGIVDLPIVIPHSVVGIMLVVTFSSAILDNYLGIVAAMLFVSSPFMINAARDGFLSIDEKLEYVARTLGASRLRVFLTVSLPLASKSILSGAVMTWARAMSEVGAILIVAYYPKTAQILVIEYFANYGLKSAMPIAVLLILLSLTVFAFLRWLSAKA